MNEMSSWRVVKEGPVRSIPTGTLQSGWPVVDASARSYSPGSTGNGSPNYGVASG